MRAVLFDSNGPADVLYVGEIDAPVLAERQVRVRVRTAGLNPFDSKVRIGAGRYAGGDPFPRTAGQDFAGVVTEVAGAADYADGTPIGVGDAVFGWADRRSMSEEVAVDIADLARMPTGVGWAVAGALPTPARTAHTCLDVVEVTDGDVVLIGAAAGGVGGLLSQMALARGATVIGTAGAANHDHLATLGVIPVAYGDGLVDRVRATGHEVTAAIDCHGREVVDAALALGVPRRRIHTIVAHDVTRDLGLADPGFPRRDRRVLDAVGAAVAAGGLDVPVQEFALDDVAAAFALLDSGHVRGKLVLRVSGD